MQATALIDDRASDRPTRQDAWVGVRKWWDRLCRRTPSSPAPADALSAQLSARLDEAASLWTTHLATAQSQTREATDQLLQGFAQILQELDAIVGADAGPGGSLDERAALLDQCDARLH